MKVSASRVLPSATAIAVSIVALVQPLRAEMLDLTKKVVGTTVRYKVVLPTGYDPAKVYPAILAFGGGPQSMNTVDNILTRNFRAEAEKRGYIIISPAAPDGDLFFERGDRAFPALLDQLLKDYRIAGGKLHVAGHSNGGLSAFHIAAKYPSYFRSVTGYPGLLDGQPDASRIQALKPLCLFMHVGDHDSGWMSAMQQQADNLKREGYRITYAVEKNQVHRLKAAEIDLSRRLFDQIESCR